MREGKGSKTAQFVAYNRAIGNLSPVVPGFSDPVAESLLPPYWTKRIKRVKKNWNDRRQVPFIAFGFMAWGSLTSIAP